MVSIDFGHLGYVLLVCSLSLLLQNQCCLGVLKFNLSTFDPNTPEILTEGDASVVLGQVQLTLNLRDQGQQGSAGRITYKEPFHLWDKKSGNLTSFTTHFSFIINSQGAASHGDGLAFYLASTKLDFPPSKASGGGLGLARNATATVTDFPFVAVEFDTHQNNWDPPGDHVGLNVNTMVSTTNVSWVSGILDGKLTDVHIIYFASSKTLSIEFSNLDSANRTRRAKFVCDIDLRDYLPEWVDIGFSASTGTSFEINTLVSWSFKSKSQIFVNNTDSVGLPPPPPPPPPPLGPPPSPPGASPPSFSPDRMSPTTVAENETTEEAPKLVFAFAMGLSCVIVGGAAFALLYFYKRKNKSRNQKSDTSVFDVSFGDEFHDGFGPRKFLYDELLEATKKFSEEEKLGEGGFGAVFRGFLKDMNLYIAVKRISKASKQGIKEYESEVKTISRLRHKNLVKLLGWCHEKELLLAYEFMPQGSLDNHLFKSKGHLLTWEFRYKIAQGLASALLYLHEEGDFCVLHRDIKSSNIMLDSSFIAKLGDFGLARFVDHAKGSQTTRLAGTLGYMAPEYLMLGKASKATDVYSFGVVLLEVASGRRVADETSMAEECQLGLVEWAWKLYGSGRSKEAADSNMNEEFDEQQFERFLVAGLWCVHPDHKMRPSIREVINVLSFEASLPKLPSQMPALAYVSSSPRELSAMMRFLSSFSQTSHNNNQPQNLNHEYINVSSVSISSTTSSLTDSPDSSIQLIS